MENLKKQNILYIVIFILFLVITFITGLNHEPWADEAQAWLIARDNTYLELITQTLKYEGHPFLWYFLLRTFILLGFAPSSTLYEYLFLIPFSLTAIGMYFFLFKSKLPTLIKVMFPFGFFICYQYSVIARNHSLFFPTIALIALIYKDRLKRPYIYSVLLLILANISAFTFTIAGVLFLFLAYDILKEKKEHILKSLTPVIIIAIGLILTMLYMNRPEDCSSVAKLNFSKFSVLYVLKALQECYFNSKNILSFAIETIILLSFYIFTAKIYCKNIQQILFFIALNLPIPTLLNILYANEWHFGNIILVLILSIWLLSEENRIEEVTINKNKIWYTLAIIILSIQIFWTVICCIHDIKNKYCSSEDVANYIKQKNLHKEKIVALGFKCISIQPYFDENIFLNYQEKSHWIWSKKFADDYVKTSMEITDTMIISGWEIGVYGEYLKALQDMYEIRVFKSNIYSKGRQKENNDLIILEKKM